MHCPTGIEVAFIAAARCIVTPITFHDAAWLRLCQPRTVASTTTGTNGGSLAIGVGNLRAYRRQVNTCCGGSPCRRAISETTAPGGPADFVLLVTASDMEDYECFTRRLAHESSEIKRFETMVTLNRARAGFNVQWIRSLVMIPDRAPLALAFQGQALRLRGRFDR